MTPEESELLYGMGLDWYQGFIATSHETVMITLFAVFVYKAATILLAAERRGSRYSMAYMTVIAVLFTCAFAMWCMDLTMFIYEPKVVFLENPSGDLASGLGVAAKLIFGILAAEAALYSYMSLLGDAIIVHRIWMLKAFPHLAVFAIPCMLFFGSVVATTMLTYCVAVNGENIILGSFVDPPFCSDVQLVTYIMPMVTTAVTTVLIGITTWKHHRNIAQLKSTTSGRSQHLTRAERVVMILVESGFFYFLFFLIQVLSNILRIKNLISSNVTLTVLMKLFVYSSGIYVGAYPTLIIVLAHTQREPEATTMGALSTLRIGGVSASAGDSLHPGSGTKNGVGTFPVGLRTVEHSDTNDSEVIELTGKIEEGST